MKKFSSFQNKKWNRIYEQEITLNTGNTQSVAATQSQVNVQVSVQNQNDQQENKEEVKQDSTVSNFVSKLFESREMSHVYHLQVKGDVGSYASHIALGAYYEGIQDLLDTFVEVYQGQYNIIEEYDIIDPNITKSKEKLNYFQETVDFIRSNRKCISNDDTHLHNIIDEIVALLYRTLYKLKYNK